MCLRRTLLAELDYEPGLMSRLLVMDRRQPTGVGIQLAGSCGVRQQSCSLKRSVTGPCVVYAWDPLLSGLLSLLSTFPHPPRPTRIFVKSSRTLTPLTLALRTASAEKTPHLSAAVQPTLISLGSVRLVSLTPCTAKHTSFEIPFVTTARRSQRIAALSLRHCASLLSVLSSRIHRTALAEVSRAYSHTFGTCRWTRDDWTSTRNYIIGPLALCSV